MRSALMTAAVALAATAAGCSAGSDKGTAEAAVTQFRQQADAGRYAEIWQGGANELKASASQDELVRVLSSLHAHYGNFRTASETNWHWNSTNGNVFVTLEYDSQFVNDRASERFVYRIENGAARLAGYNRRSAGAGQASAEGNASVAK